MKTVDCFILPKDSVPFVIKARAQQVDQERDGEVYTWLVGPREPRTGGLHSYMKESDVYLTLEAAVSAQLLRLHAELIELQAEINHLNEHPQDCISEGYWL